jgi:hypothetical protein
VELSTAARHAAPYDVTREGDRLLVILGRAGAATALTSGAEGVELVLNVFEELRARAGG